MHPAHPSPSAAPGPPCGSSFQRTENSIVPSSPLLSNSAQSVSAKTEYPSETIAPARISSQWKSPPSARCKSLAPDTPASSPFPSPPRESRGDASQTHRAPSPPFPIARAGARNRQSCTVPEILPAQTHPASKVFLEQDQKLPKPHRKPAPPPPLSLPHPLHEAPGPAHPPEPPPQ